MRKRVTLIENITFMAIIAAFYAIASLIVSFIPALSLLFMLVLPLLSVLVVLYCENKYLIIYFIAALVLSLIASIHNLYVSFFYLIPALITGIVMGLLIKAKVTSSLVFLLTSFIQVGISFLGIVFIRWIYEIDIVNSILSLLNLTAHPHKLTIVSVFILLMAYAQTALSLIIVEDELPKLNLEINNEYIPYTSLISLSLYIIGALILAFYPPIAYILVFVYIYLSLTSLLFIYKNEQIGKKLLITGFALFVVSFFASSVLLDSIYVPFVFGIIFIPSDTYLVVKYIKTCRKRRKDS